MSKRLSRSNASQLSAARSQYFEASRFDPSNQRYGLFSFSGTLAISPQAYFSPSPLRRPSSSPNPRKRGPRPPTPGKPFFSQPAYMTEERSAVLPLRKNKTEPKFRLAQDWKPGGAVKERASPYPHKQEFDTEKPSRRGEDGMVKVAPRNFYTIPTRPGTANSTPGLLIGGRSFEYLAEEYERNRKIKDEERKKHKALMRSKWFKCGGKGRETFASNKETYGPVEVKKKKVIRSPKQIKERKPLMPSGPCTKGTLGKFPEYIPDPLIFPVRKVKGEDKEQWKRTTKERSRPSSSIAYRSCNIRTEYPFLRNLS
jgi:hypothetical protein